MKLTQTLLALALTGTALGCAPTSDLDSQVRSFLGIEAGQNDAVRNGDAPTFVALSDWFNGFVVGGATSGGGQTLSFSTLSQRIPTQSQASLASYVDSQLARNAVLKQALAANDDATLGDLLELETRELYDIVMVMLNRRYQPQTADGFAAFLAGSRTVSYVHTFALEFLSKALSTRLLTEVQASLEVERANYLKSLTSLYLGNATAKAKLASDLDAEAQALAAMRQALAGGAGLALNGDDGTAAGGQVTGGAAALAQYQAGLGDYTSALGAGLPTDLIALAQGDPTETAYEGGAATTAASTATATQIAAGQNPAAPDPSSQNAQGARTSASLTDLAPTPLAAIIPPVPPIDCTKMGLTGKALITCQFHFAYAQTVIHPNVKRVATRQLRSLGEDDSANTATLEAAHTPTLDQGQEPSCTSHALAYGVNAFLNAGVAAATSLSLDAAPSCDPEDIWAAQGEDAELTAAMDAVRVNGCAGVTVAEASETAVLSTLSLDDQTSAPSVDEQVMTQIDQGGVIYIGVNIDASWIAGGGGAEFGLDDSAPSVYGCDPSGPGHALLATGYQHVNGNLVLVVHNSWGDDWGSKGYALMDFAGCAGNAELYIPKFAKQ